MLSNRIKSDVKSERNAPGQLSQVVKLGPLLAILLLSMLAAVVFCFSVLAATPECWRQPAEPRELQFAGSSSSGPLQRFLHHDDRDGAGQLAMYPPDSSVALDTLNTWPLPDSSGLAAPFYARPEPMDADYDGYVDQLISTDFSGRVWLTDVAASGFDSSSLLADLTHSDWRFIANAGIVDISLPLPLRPDGLTSQHKVVLLIARNIISGEDALVALRIPGFSAERTLPDFAALYDRTILTEEERTAGLSNAQWSAIVDSAGWWVRLSGQLTQPPKVVAGVIYSAVATSDFTATACADQSAEHSLVAMHLHSAGLVYSQRRFRLLNGAGQLKLQQQADGSAALVLDNIDEQQLVLADLKMISPACPDCSEQLQLDQFPRWRKLATYRQETGAH
ncbi:hypothetical protein SAMN06297280_2664 [Arsukibacterium tuosuense]|uniref:Uncharacterized protein n=1 Tax=Arsukibacterium tuosuense TaxID=1323745 RepID=A0A285J2R2_9GAMM|nr:hypothetical protein [Arsukibacterium tuosuense]SNY54492.1 hypothetical protein SAMN06297280_2664 [Arsukibacterium tuosuense]